MINLTNGNPQNLSGLIVPNGSITFQLNVDATVIASPFGFVLAGLEIAFQFNEAGQIQPNGLEADAQIYSNAELNPQNSSGLGTYYLVTFYDANGTRINKSPMWWQFTQPANSTVDISQMQPFATTGGNIIFYPTGFGSGSVTSVSFTGDGVVFVPTPGTPVTTIGTLTPILAQQAANTVLAGPASGSPFTPTFRALVSADLPAGTGTIGGSIAATQIAFGSGANTIAGSDNLVWDGSTQTITGFLTINSTGDDVSVFGNMLANADGGLAGALFNTQTAASSTNSPGMIGVTGGVQHFGLGNVPRMVGVQGQVDSRTGSGGTIAIAANFYGTNPDLSGGAQFTAMVGYYQTDLNPSNSAKITSAIAIHLENQTGGMAILTDGTSPSSFGGYINSVTGFRFNNTATSGNVLRGNGTNFISATLAAADLSNGVTGTGAVVLASAISGFGTGSVTSVTFTGDGTVLSSTPSSAVTTTGTVTASLKTQNANVILAGPTTGSAANPTFRALVLADLPAIAASNLSNGVTGSGAIVLAGGSPLFTGNVTHGLASFTAAVANSPTLIIAGSYENASTPTFAEDSWTVQDVVGAGLNGTSTLTFTHSGTTGTASITFPSVIINLGLASVTAAGSIHAAAGLNLGWLNRSQMQSPSDGVITATNSAQTSFARFQFGGTTSSFPAIGVSGTGLVVELADASANAPITASLVIASTAVEPSAAGGATVGTAALPFSSVYVGTAATNNIQVTGTATAARVFTLPDANSNPVQPLSSAVSGEFIQYIDSAGVQHLASGGGGSYPGTGSIAITVQSNPTTLNLTTVGTRDWLANASPGAAGVYRLALSGGLHSKAQGQSEMMLTFDWVWGGNSCSLSAQNQTTPTVTATASDDICSTPFSGASKGALLLSCSTTSAVGYGYRFKVPADSFARTLVIYGAAFSCVATITCTLSDGSVSSTTANFDTGSNTLVEKGFSIVYNSARDGQEMVVTVLVTTNHSFTPYTEFIAATLA